MRIERERPKQFSDLPTAIQDKTVLAAWLQVISGGALDLKTLQKIFPGFQGGGPVDFAKDKPPRIGDAGLYALHDKEMVLSAQDTKSLNDKEMVLSAPDLSFAKNLYTGGFGTGSGGGNITIVNAPTQPVTNLAQNSTNINQIQVPESAVNNERTFRTVAHGQMARA